jgi:hypothetical protein
MWIFHFQDLGQTVARETVISYILPFMLQPVPIRFGQETIYMKIYPLRLHFAHSKILFWQLFLFRITGWASPGLYFRAHGHGSCTFQCFPLCFVILPFYVYSAETRVASQGKSSITFGENSMKFFKL